MTMYSRKLRWLYVAIFLFASSLFAEEVEAPKKADYKDAFLAFALEKAEKYSGAAENAVEKAVDVTMREAPELAKEYLAWKWWFHLIGFVAPILANIVVIGGMIYSIKKGQECDWDEPLPIVGSMGLGMTSIFSVIWLLADGFSSLLSMIQITVAPRIYIIEALRDFVK